MALRKTAAKRKAPAKPKAKRGRKPTFSATAIAKHKAALLDWIADGETVRDYCRQPKTPSFWTVYQWRQKDSDFATRFARARECGEQAILQDMLRIADTPCIGQREEVDADGKVVKVVREDMLGHRKLQVWTREKLLAKWNPTKYGDKLQVGGDGSGVPIHLSHEERAARINAIIEKAEARQGKRKRGA